MNAADTIIANNPNRSTVNHRAASIVGRAAFSALDCGSKETTQSEMGMHVGCAFSNEFGADDYTPLARQVRAALASLGYVW